MLVELTDPDNVALFEKRHGEIIVSPVIVSHMMTRVTVRRELRAVFEELFGPSGAEIQYRRIADYAPSPGSSQAGGEPPSKLECTFAELQRAADARGEIAIGIRRAGQEQSPGGGVELNPGRDERLELIADDTLVVLTTSQTT